MDEQAHRCTHCGEVIAESERWEYWKSYPNRTPEAAKERVHTRCVQIVVRETLAALARVPEDKREALTFEF